MGHSIKPLDILKAGGIGLLVWFGENFAAFLTIFVVQYLQANGWIAPDGLLVTPSTVIWARASTWAARIIGVVLMIGLNLIFSRARPQRNPFAFAGISWAAYFIIEEGLSGFVGMFSVFSLIKLGTRLAGAIGGAWLATRFPKRDMQARPEAVF